MMTAVVFPKIINSFFDIPEKIPENYCVMGFTSGLILTFFPMAATTAATSSVAFDYMAPQSFTSNTSLANAGTYVFASAAHKLAIYALPIAWNAIKAFMH